MTQMKALGAPSGGNKSQGSARPDCVVAPVIPASPARRPDWSLVSAGGPYTATDQIC